MPTGPHWPPKVVRASAIREASREAEGDGRAGDGERRLAAAFHRQGRAAEQDEIALVACESVDVVRLALHEQDVADAQPHRAEVLAQMLAVPEHGQDDDAEGVAHARVPDELMIQPGVRADHDLRQREVHAQDPSAAAGIQGALQARLSKQVHDLGRAALDEEEIVGLQPLLLEGRPEDLLPANELEEADLLRETREVRQRPPDEPGRAGEQDLRHVLTRRLRAHGGDEASPVGQQLGTDEHEVEQRGDAEHSAHRKDLEEPEAVVVRLGAGKLRLPHDAVHQQRRRRADERERAAGDGGVGERQEQPARADLDLVAGRDQQRQEQHDDAGVVHDAGEHHHDR